MATLCGRETSYTKENYQKSQLSGESDELYIRSLHDLARYCNFGEHQSDNVRDRLIVGMTNKELPQKLRMEQDDLTLEKTAGKARNLELKPRMPQRWMQQHGVVIPIQKRVNGIPMNTIQYHSVTLKHSMVNR